MFSVVIRTYNSAKTIVSCLDSLFQQTIMPGKVLIIDSGSTDGTLEIAKNYNVQIHHYPKNEVFNYSKSLNIGFSEVESRFVLILSSHVILKDSNTIFYMISILESKKNTRAVSVLRTDHNSREEIEKIDKVRYDFTTINNFRGRAMYNFCALIEKKYWNQYNFNEFIPRCEDQDWSYHFLKQGYNTCVINYPRVYYKNPYYNIQKDLWDYIVIGENFYPKLISNNYLILTMKKGILSFIQNRKISNLREVMISLRILKHKYLKKEIITSSYYNTGS